MAVPTGQVSMQDIVDEYGGSAPHAISEYYSKGNAPGSGEIQIHADFQGTSNTFTLTISSNQQQLNLATYASNNSWDGSTAAIITIASGVHITTGDTTAALSTGSFPGGLTILNSGNIHGDGGNGGNAANGAGPGANGSAAGHAIAVTNSTSLSITNNSGGVIAGGGGGGGAGSGRHPNHGGFQAGGGGGGGRCGNGHSTSGGTGYQGRNGSGGSYSSAGGGHSNGAGGGNWGAGGGTGQNLTWSGGSGGAGGDPVSGSYTLTANNGSMHG